jgi:methylmalonyl-CoA mutase cobalamin-binding subunit
MSTRIDLSRIRLSRALENFNPQGAHNVLDEIFASHNIDAALSDVVLPYLQSLNPGSAPPTASTLAHIQFSTSVLEGRLLALGRGWESGGRPAVVVAYPGDERHTFGGIAFCLALRDRGWRIIFLGTDTPAQSAQDTAKRTDAQVVVLAARQPTTFSELRLSSQRLDAQHRLVLAGDGATENAARDLGAELLPRHPILAAQELHHRLGSDRQSRSLLTPPPRRPHSALSSSGGGCE